MRSATACALPVPRVASTHRRRTGETTASHHGLRNSRRTDQHRSEAEEVEKGSASRRPACCRPTCSRNCEGCCVRREITPATAGVLREPCAPPGQEVRMMKQVKRRTEPNLCVICGEPTPYSKG